MTERGIYLSAWLVQTPICISLRFRVYQTAEFHTPASYMHYLTTEYNFAWCVVYNWVMLIKPAIKPVTFCTSSLCFVISKTV